MRARLLVSGLIVTASVSFAHVAFGQDAPPPTAIGSDDDNLPPVANDARPIPSPPPAPGPSKGRQLRADGDGDDESDGPRPTGRDHARFRGGVSLYGGGYLIRGTGIGYGGLEGRLGVQIRDWVGIYAEPAFLVGADSSGVIGRVSLGVIPEFSVADIWFIGAGPELYAVAGATKNSYFVASSIVGVNARTGFAIGSKRPGRRHSFTIAADLRLDFFDGHPGVAPALSLGYDAW